MLEAAVEGTPLASVSGPRLAELAAWNAATLARAGIDVLSLDDDVGMPGTMMIGPHTWREFFKPAYAAMFDAVRRSGKHVWMHCYGVIEEIIPDLIEMGVDILNPVQTTAKGMDPVKP